MSKVVVITGASSGIGRETAILLLKEGHTVYSLSRRSSVEGVRHIKTDVSSCEEVKRAIEQIFKIEGKIDVLINNAGMGISGAIENTSVEDIEKLFSVNLLGSICCAKEVVPHMRRNANGGYIINISSAAAKFPLPFQAFYSASKAAITSFSDALRVEVKPFGIKVLSLLPGDVKTDFTSSRVKNISNDPTYGDRITKSVSTMEKDEQSGILPVVMAKKIVKQIKRKNPPPIVIGGFKYAVLVFLTRLLPHRVILWLIGLLYG